MPRIRQRVTLPNGEKAWCTGKTLGEAIENLLLRYNAVNTVTESKLPTLKEYADRWFSLYHEKKVKPNTAKNTRGYLDNYIYPAFGDKRLDEITADDVQALFNSMSEKAESTVDKIKVTLNHILRKAYATDHLIDWNVMAADDYVISKIVTERKALTPIEALDVIAHLDLLDGNDKKLISLGLYTGMRRGEILALRWEDISFAENLIYVHHGVTYDNNRPIVGSPKSKAGIRMIPIKAELKNILSEYQQREGYVIENTRNSDTPISETAYRRMWSRICKKINMHGATLHCLRHTYATMTEAHTDSVTLMAVLGHADPKTTRRYTHVINENVRRLADVDIYVTPETPKPVEE